MRGYTTQDKIAYWLFKDRIPVVKLLIVSNVVTFLAMELFHVAQIPQLLAFSPGRAMDMPWTLFTYPLLGVGGVMSMLFAGYWLWVAGGSLERAWGSRTFGLYFFLMSAVTALGLYVGSFLPHTVPVSAVGLWLPISGVTIAFAMMNPEQQILFFFVIPLKLKYLALIDVIVVLVQYGSTNPLLGLCALAGCGVSYWYVRSGRSISLPTPRPRGEVIRINPRYAVRKSWNPIKRYHDYREQKRLKDFLGKSGLGDE